MGQTQAVLNTSAKCFAITGVKTGRILKKGYRAIKTWVEDQPKVPTVQLDPAHPMTALIQLTERKLDTHTMHAKSHPFINFMNGCWRRADESEQRNVSKAIENFTTYLESLSDKGAIQEFFNFFASRQGLFLYRCSLISVRYFSRMLNKLSHDPKLISHIFLALNTPKLADCDDAYDILLQAILTSEDLATLDNQDDITLYTLALIDRTID
jgi:hypothetical protein